MPYDTPRLRLRELEERDERDVYALLSDERVVRHMLFPLFTPEQTQAFVRRSRAAAAERPRSSLTLAVTPATDDQVIGLCGLVLETQHESGEAWYLLGPAHWGRGLTSEAAAALIRVGFGELGLHRIWATCLPQNPASARVLEKLGFRREGYLRESLRIHGEWRDCHLYAILRREWEARRGVATPTLPPAAPG